MVRLLQRVQFLNFFLHLSLKLKYFELLLVNIIYKPVMHLSFLQKVPFFVSSTNRKPITVQALCVEQSICSRVLGVSAFAHHRSPPRLGLPCRPAPASGATGCNDLMGDRW